MVNTVDLGVISQAEAAARLKISRARVSQLVKRGQLKTIGVAGRPLVTLASIVALELKRHNEAT